MNRNLLFVSVLLLGSFTAVGQKEFSNTSNISADSFSVKGEYSGKAGVKIYPNPSYGKLTISTTTSSTLHFYIFDLEGTLVYQAVLNNKDRKTIANLKKGTYLYDVFENDLSIEEGKIIIK